MATYFFRGFMATNLHKNPELSSRSAEIAESLGISRHTVETQMGIAYEKLRKALQNALPLLVLLWA